MGLLGGSPFRSPANPFGQSGMFDGMDGGAGIQTNPAFVPQQSPQQMPQFAGPAFNPQSAQQPPQGFPSAFGPQALRQLPQLPQGMPVDQILQRLPPLGGSMRQPFDYAAAQAAINPPVEGLPRKPGFNDPGGLAERLQNIGAILRDDPNVWMELQKLRGSQSDNRSAQSLAQLKARLEMQQWRHQDFAEQNRADLRAAEPFTIGRERLQYDPRTGETAPVYHGAADFENYAAAQGYEPGTPEYLHAAQDFILRGNGPTALKNDQSLDDYRTGNRVKVEGVRQGNRVGLEGVRQNNRVGLEGVRQNDRMTVHGAPSYRDAHGSPGRSGPALPSATGPNGQKIHYDAGQGKWIDQNGRPVG